jgi:hypothetical protein
MMEIFNIQMESRLGPQVLIAFLNIYILVYTFWSSDQVITPPLTVKTNWILFYIWSVRIFLSFAEDWVSHFFYLYISRVIFAGKIQKTMNY